MRPHPIYVITGASGDYSAHQIWMIAWAPSQEAAEATCEALEEEQRRVFAWFTEWLNATPRPSRDPWPHWPSPEGEVLQGEIKAWEQRRDAEGRAVFPHLRDRELWTHVQSHVQPTITASVEPMITYEWTEVHDDPWNDPDRPPLLTREIASAAGKVCKVCGATPNRYGEREHGRGCYVVDENGGGVDFP